MTAPLSDPQGPLTDEEREQLWQSGEVSIINCDYDSNLVTAVESIIANRVRAASRTALIEAADAIGEAANPDQVWQVADTLRARAGELRQ